jgi:hypothetical protein
MKGDQASRAMLGGAMVGNMTYHGGAVQHTQKVYTIFWNPTGPAFPSGYQATINQFVQDLNGSSYYAIGSQYGDGIGNISTSVTFGGTWLDTFNAIQNNPPTATELANEVSRAMMANGWASDANSYFQVYTPAGYGTSTGYCGYHEWANPAFGLILFPADHDSGTCFPGGNYPHNQFVDAAINTSAHEIMETVTNPQGGGWYYVDGSGEIGDLCNFNFGTQASDGSNVTLNGRKYLVQQQWSNAISGCALSYNGVPPATTLLSPSGKIATNAPTFTWNTVSSATVYYLSVQNSSGTAVLQQFYSSAVCGISTCSVTPSVALSRGTYRWSIETWNSSGYGSPSSNLTFLFGLSAPGDFDGDGKADVTVFRPSTGTWYTRYTATPTSAAIVWGGGSDIPASGDYDGDGKSDVAVFRPSTGTWFIRYSGTPTSAAIVWGGAGDIPVPADYDGDGITDIAVFRPSTGTWYIKYSATPTSAALVWGGGADIPVPGDYDGDGKTDIAVFRPSTGTWYIRYTATPTSAAFMWGGGADIPVAADYDGDGKTDIAVFRPSTGTWYIRYTATPTSAALVWGGGSDIPVPGDYDGDGLVDIAVFRPSSGTWYIRYSGTPTSAAIVWGGGTDIPILER